MYLFLNVFSNDVCMEFLANNERNTLRYRSIRQYRLDHSWLAGQGNNGFGSLHGEVSKVRKELCQSLSV